MARYLLTIQAKTYLDLGKSIAQFLSYQDEADYIILKWLTIDKGDEKAYSVTYHEVFDEEDEQNFDIGGFLALDPTELPFGVLTEFDTVDEALRFAEQAYGALAHRYVTESMIDEEYAAYLKNRQETRK